MKKENIIPTISLICILFLAAFIPVSFLLDDHKMGQYGKPSYQSIEWAAIKIHSRTKEDTSSHRLATWYNYQLNGIWWSIDHNTAASRVLERFEMYRITNLENDKSIDVFINDYGPMSCEDRIKNGIIEEEICTERDIDLSSHAFAQIADLKRGRIFVTIEGPL